MNKMTSKRDTNLQMNGDLRDQHYRYMVKPLETVECKNYTTVKNLENIAKQTQRPGSYIANYMAYRIGTVVKFDKERNEWKFSGKHPREFLQNLYFDFVKMYVLCQRCHNPETNPVVKGNKKCKELVLECRSCGFTSTHLKSCMEDKIVKFMCLHPMEPIKLKATKDNSSKEKTDRLETMEDDYLSKFEFPVQNDNDNDNDDEEWDIDGI
jgi:translation initiation factor 2 beta subunit (eIF-2beta)/eIF-5